MILGLLCDISKEHRREGCSSHVHALSCHSTCREGGRETGSRPRAIRQSDIAIMPVARMTVLQRFELALLSDAGTLVRVATCRRKRVAPFLRVGVFDFFSYFRCVFSVFSSRFAWL